MTTIHTYRSAETGLFVNSYLVEGDEAVVAIDSPLLISDGVAFRARLDALKKPLAAFLLTHPHPDHYNTITQVVEGHDAPIIALARVDEVMRRDEAFRRDKWSPVFGDEWPRSVTFPTAVEQDGFSIDLGGLRFRASDLGRGESESETAWILENDEESVVFVGDLVFNGLHSYVGDGLTWEWLESLDRASSRLRGCVRLYSGHGEPGGLELLQLQKSYLLMLRESVRRIGGGSGELTDAQRNELTQLMAEYLPRPLAWLVTAGSDAVAAELKAAS